MTTATISINDITVENIQTWLSNQPAENTFDMTSGTNCVFARYVATLVGETCSCNWDNPQSTIRIYVPGKKGAQYASEEVSRFIESIEMLQGPFKSVSIEEILKHVA